MLAFHSPGNGKKIELSTAVSLSHIEGSSSITILSFFFFTTVTQPFILDQGKSNQVEELTTTRLLKQFE